MQTTYEVNKGVRQGFSLASALGHSPEQILDVREQAGQVGHFVREHFRQCTVFDLLRLSLIGQNFERVSSLDWFYFFTCSNLIPREII